MTDFGKFYLKMLVLTNCLSLILQILILEEIYPNMGKNFIVIKHYGLIAFLGILIPYFKVLNIKKYQNKPFRFFFQKNTKN